MYRQELEQILPQDLPNRETVVAKAAQHLALIEEANRQFNLTRITGAREAAIKHVLDSVMPWRLFAAARHILDAGTGAGFPGIPLALVLPDVQFTLVESIQKKARFVESAIGRLELTNATCTPRRAEEIVRELRPDIVTARAMAPVSRILTLFKPLPKMLLYKGPDVEEEIAEAAAEARKRRVRIEIVMRYDLPESQGTRTIVELQPLR
ncbi:MAG TPA: 16S rRNA (guanine(527)-N(7))-methyltransferase RsmG [Bryobacteraceae bacterium]|jgi:16S rRNA (guanine527-N7)-methyltransferase